MNETKSQFPRKRRPLKSKAGANLFPPCSKLLISSIPSTCPRFDMRCFARLEVTRCLWLKPAASLDSPGSISTGSNGCSCSGATWLYLEPPWAAAPSSLSTKRLLTSSFTGNSNNLTCRERTCGKKSYALYKVDCSRRTVERIVEKTGLSKKGLR